MSRTLFDGQNKQTEYESKLSICEHAGESTVPKELTSFSAPPLHKGGNLLANLQLRVFVSPFYQMARRDGHTPAKKRYNKIAYKWLNIDTICCDYDMFPHTYRVELIDILYDRLINIP